jgi:hypothetical protein
MNIRDARNRIRRALLAESLENDQALRTLKVQPEARVFPNQIAVLDVDTGEQFVLTITKARRRRDAIV